MGRPYNPRSLPTTGVHLGSTVNICLRPRRLTAVPGKIPSQPSSARNQSRHDRVYRLVSCYVSHQHTILPLLTPANPLPEADTIRILVATDNHVGYEERDAIRKDDSWRTFDEIMRLAKTEDVHYASQSLLLCSR